MNKNAIIFLTVIMFLFLINPVLSFDWTAHSYLAQKVCDKLNCSCYTEIEDGSLVPDRDFMDFTNHKCYHPESCIPSIFYTCPTEYDCPALVQATKWLNQSLYDSGCTRWWDIGISSHYFFDSKVVWHQVKDESYIDCHKAFEDKVGNNIKAGYSEWSVTVCDQTVYSSNLTMWIDEFANSVPVQTNNSQTTNNTNLTLPTNIKQKIVNVITTAKSYQTELAGLTDELFNLFGFRVTAGQFIVTVLSLVGIVLFIFWLLTHWHLLLGLVIILIIAIAIIYFYFPSLFVSFTSVIP